MGFKPDQILREDFVGIVVGEHALAEAKESHMLLERLEQMQDQLTHVLGEVERLRQESHRQRQTELRVNRLYDAFTVRGYVELSRALWRISAPSQMGLFWTGFKPAGTKMMQLYRTATEEACVTASDVLHTIDEEYFFAHAPPSVLQMLETCGVRQGVDLNYILRQDRELQRLGGGGAEMEAFVVQYRRQHPGQSLVEVLGALHLHFQPRSKSAPHSSSRRS